MQGKGVSRGVTSGPLYFFRRSSGEVTQQTVENIEGEKARLKRAQAQSMTQLEALAEQCRAEAGDESAVLFETHAMFVEDEDYVECILSTLEEEHCNVEYAVSQAGEQFAAMFAAMDDEYMKAKPPTSRISPGVS